MDFIYLFIAYCIFSGPLGCSNNPCSADQICKPNGSNKFQCIPAEQHIAWKRYQNQMFFAIHNAMGRVYDSNQPKDEIMRHLYLPHPRHINSF